ncbi:gliding motility-associated-like protein [Catalinimonas alkaloidigena]|uniref:T9SS type B sorting domain-containing protein n=1 Tax=Catalinimonas alkaloidigena TaxID=1075417 RepID=UPI002406DC93|nr:gliding motility-associated C-terminal domain-containing protein [Catalinimonas alkaloidigena]MDF9794987.1 gliding motility-associated-like protein [Catalinimonas alkaloidigena]
MKQVKSEKAIPNFLFVRITLTIFVHMVYLSMYAQIPKEVNMVTAPDPQHNHHFGLPVSIEGNYAITGANNDATNGTGSGAAYIFKKDGEKWSFHTKLLAPDGVQGDSFGEAVSIYGNFAIVGASFDDDLGSRSGSAYIFYRDMGEWRFHSKIHASEGKADEMFGNSVSIHGNYALIGSKEGAAYVFVLQGDNWIQQAKLTNPDDNIWAARFGSFVSLDQNYAIVSAYRENEDSGAAYIFARNGEQWTFQAKLTASDASEGASFGISVSIEDPYVVIGAFRDDNTAENAGAAYIFLRNGEDWIQQKKIISPDGDKNDWFGVGISISGNYLLVGADRDSELAYKAGAAYLYHREGSDWKLQSKIMASNGKASDVFGQWLSIDRKNIMIGANSSDIFIDNFTYYNDAGSAYFYKLDTLVVDDDCEKFNLYMDLGSDTLLCQNAEITLDAGIDNVAYWWSDGQTDRKISVNEPGKYWVSVYKDGCFASDTIHIDYLNVDLGKDSLFCGEVDHILRVDNRDVSIQWSTGEIGSEIRITQPGIYWVEVSNGTCTVKDSINVTLLQKPDLGPDTLLCDSQKQVLKVGGNSGGILWSTGDTTAQISVTSSGLYWVEVQNGSCVVMDSINIDFKYTPEVLPESIDTLVCEGEVFEWDVYLEGFQQVWNDGSSSPSRDFSKSGRYTVFWENECMSFTRTLNLETENCNCDIFMPNVFTPNADGKNDFFQPELHHNITDATLKIYNRVGKLIFISNQTPFWNGILNGVEAPAGNYYWTLEYYCSQNAKTINYHQKGWVTLLRKKK